MLVVSFIYFNVYWKPNILPWILEPRALNFYSMAVLLRFDIDKLDWNEFNLISYSAICLLIPAKLVKILLWLSIIIVAWFCIYFCISALKLLMPVNTSVDSSNLLSRTCTLSFTYPSSTSILFYNSLICILWWWNFYLMLLKIPFSNIF